MKKIIPLIFVMFILIFLINSFSVNAVIDSYDVRADIFGEKTIFEIDINYGSGVHENIIIPEENKILFVKLDGIKQDISNEINEIIVGNTKKIEISYIDYTVVDRETFVENFLVFEYINEFKLTIVLPENAKLKEAIKEQGISTSSIFPEGYEIKSDGKLIYLEWYFNNLKKGTHKAIYINYETEKNYLVLVISLLFILAITYIIINHIKYKKKTKKRNKNIVLKEENREQETKIVEKDKYEEHLKEDELQIVNILKKKEGETDQGTLRVITGFSKAHLSRLLSELESRKIIYKEKRGRKNKVFLKKQ